MQAGIILAAGLSSRMQRFKPLLPLGNKSIIGHTVHHLRSAGVDEIIVVTGHCHAQLAAHLCEMNVTPVYNSQYAAADMFHSVKTGISALSDVCRRIVITPADIPLVQPATVRTLLQTPGRFVKPVFNGKGGHPIVIDRQLALSLLQCRCEGGLKGALEQLAVQPVKVPVADAGTLLDADTPEDYEKLLHYYEQYVRITREACLE